MEHALFSWQRLAKANTRECSEIPGQMAGHLSYNSSKVMRESSSTVWLPTPPIFVERGPAATVSVAEARAAIAEVFPADDEVLRGETAEVRALARLRKSVRSAIRALDLPAATGNTLNETLDYLARLVACVQQTRETQIEVEPCDPAPFTQAMARFEEEIEAGYALPEGWQDIVAAPKLEWNRSVTQLVGRLTPGFFLASGDAAA